MDLKTFFQDLDINKKVSSIESNNRKKDIIIDTWLQDTDKYESMIREFLEYGLNECNDEDLEKIYHKATRI